jgi:hypothetical protein
MVQQDVRFYNEPIIISPVIVEEYEEESVEGVKVKIKKMRDNSGEYYDVKFNQYVIRINDYTPYISRMAIYALLMIEKRLLFNGYVEDVINWDEKEWTVWDPYRLFIYGEFKIFRNGNYEKQEGDALINLIVKRIYAPYAENPLKVYIKAFMMPAPVIE